MLPPPVPDDAEQARRRLTMNAIARAARRRRDGARVVGNAMRRLSGKQRDAPSAAGTRYQRTRGAKSRRSGPIK